MCRKPIRILHCVNKMDRAGLETMIMNYYRNIDREKVQFDFLTHRIEDGDYDDEIKKMGGKIYHAPRLMPHNYTKYCRYMKKLFAENPEYKIVHSHIDTMSFFPLREAKKNNILIRISHSHSSKLDFDFKLPIKYYAKTQINKVNNVKFSCGDKASKFLYGSTKDVYLVNNAIDLEKFSFNSNVREKIRQQLNIPSDAVVIGHVGRYIYIKNQTFLIDILNEIVKKNKNYYLVLIGAGNDEKMLKEKVCKLNLEKNVIFVGSRNDVNKYYNIFDIFVMPSLFEGLPLVGVEAQANGMPTLFSDTISNEIIMTPNSQMISLEKKINDWVNIIIEIPLKRQSENINLLREKGYDIKYESKKLQDKYYSLLIEKGECKNEK